jgi:hypothetical protein
MEKGNKKVKLNSRASRVLLYRIQDPLEIQRRNHPGAHTSLESKHKTKKKQNTQAK